MENISSRSLKKTCHQRLLSVYFSTFDWWNLQLHQKKPILLLGNMAKLITQKLKSKHLAISFFSGQRIFWGRERKYFPHILGQRFSLRLWQFSNWIWISKKIQIISCHTFEFFFASSLIKVLNLYYYDDGLQPKMSVGIINEHECNLT